MASFIFFCAEFIFANLKNLNKVIFNSIFRLARNLGLKMTKFFLLFRVLDGPSYLFKSCFDKKNLRDWVFFNALIATLVLLFEQSPEDMRSGFESCLHKHCI